MTEYMNKLIDRQACLQVLGSILQNPLLLNDLNRPIKKSEFNFDPFFEIVFVALSNLFASGAKVLDIFAIDSYIMSKKEWKEYYQDRGLEYITDAKDLCEPENYDYYYHRVRKYSLLRYYEGKGLDTRPIFDADKAEDDPEEQQKFDKLTEQEIIGMVENVFVIHPDMEYCANTLTEDCLVGDGLIEMIEEYKNIPDFGLPFNSPALTTLARGQRLGCCVVRGSVTGGGKTRSLVADACKISVPYYYDVQKKKWIHTGISEPCTFIVTEMLPKEVKSIFLAVVSGVDEEKIKVGTCNKDEEKRVQKAAAYIKESPLYLCFIPEFSIDDIKNIVKKYNREYSVNYFFFDYIFTTLRLTTQLNKKMHSPMKDYERLLLFITELKAIAQQLNIYLCTAVQLNGEVVNAAIKDNNVLSGAKSIAFKVDVGFNQTPITKAEMKKIEPILRKMMGVPKPNMVTTVYKLRSGSLTRVIIWSFVDFSNMRVKDILITDYNYEPIDINFTEIVGEDVEEDADQTIEKVIKSNSISLSEVHDTVVEEDDVEDEDEDETEDEPVNRKFNW